MSNIEKDLETLEQAKPYIRSILAFILKLRMGSTWGEDTCYKTADSFIRQLEYDVKTNGV